VAASVAVVVVVLWIPNHILWLWVVVVVYMRAVASLLVVAVHLLMMTPFLQTGSLVVVLCIVVSSVVVGLVVVMVVHVSPLQGSQPSVVVKRNVVPNHILWLWVVVVVVHGGWEGRLPTGRRVLVTLPGRRTHRLIVVMVEPFR